MLNVAAEISQLVHSIKDMDTIGVKIASAEGSVLAQQTTAQASTALYNVITKCASDYVPDEKLKHQRIVSFIDKVASVLGRPSIPAEIRLKLAAAVTADEALTMVMSDSPLPPDEHHKYAEAQMFGREFVMELLQGVI